MKQVKQLLENWGIWARCRLGTEYAPVAAGMMEAVEWETRTYRGEWNDDIALTVDRAVAELGQYGEEGQELKGLLSKHYVGGASARFIARTAGCRPDKVTRELSRAEMWVAGRLCGQSLEAIG